MLGDVQVPAVTSTRILGVTFSSDYTWTAHVTGKITAAEHKFRALLRNGLVGGSLSLNAATLFASAILWPSLHFGRIATSIFLSTHEAEQSRLDTAHIGFGRQILGVSGRAAAAGVLGELGWWPDGVIGAKHNLLFLNRAASADPLSWQFQSLLGSRDLPRHPLLVWFDTMQDTLDLPDLPQDPEDWKRTLRDAIPAWADESWAEMAKEHPRLRLYSRHKTSLTPPFLASLPNFPGRSALTRARINDYDFSRVRHSGGCPYCGRALPDQGEESDETLSLIHFLVDCETSNIRFI